jgi:hypothetical protein
MTPRSAAICLAQSAMRLMLTHGKLQYGIKWRYRDGRWDVYSFDVDGWHILLKDNGVLVYANHRTNSVAPQHHEKVI